MTLNRRILAYPVLALLLWVALNLWASWEGDRRASEERAGRVAETILRTAKKYRRGFDSAVAEGVRLRAVARQADARSRRAEDSMNSLTRTLLGSMAGVDSAAAELGDTGSVNSWRDLFNRQTHNVWTARAALAQADTSIHECRISVDSLMAAGTSDSLALLKCAGRVDSLTIALDSLNRAKTCKILFVSCPSRKSAFVYGAVAWEAVRQFLRAVASH